MNEASTINSASQAVPRSLNNDSYLKLWHRAFTHHGRPIFPIGSPRYFRSVFNLSGRTYCSTETEGPDYQKKLALMRAQRSAWDQCDCLLCRSLGENAGPDVLCRLPESFIIPNRYPSHLGHGLLLPEEHRAGLTRDDILLAALVSERTNCVITKNHPRDAASVPEHVHVHLIPRPTPIFPLLDELERRLGVARGPLYIEELGAEFTPFAALMISGGTVQSLAATAWEIINALDEADEVYTLSYHRRRLLISPRNTESIEQTLRLGALVALHTFGEVDVQTAARYIPLRGRFDWTPFIAGRPSQAAVARAA